jgi:hypothetical protein
MTQDFWKNRVEGQHEIKNRTTIRSKTPTSEYIQPKELKELVPFACS